MKNNALFPFIHEQYYNIAIKEIFKLAGINRVVTLLDPTTRKEVRVPISDYSISHMARRTFCGNVYKNVKDPSIVGSMSGHKEGSKALARYRDIDQDIKKDALSVFEWFVYKLVRFLLKIALKSVRLRRIRDMS